MNETNSFNSTLAIRGPIWKRYRIPLVVNASSYEEGIPSTQRQLNVRFVCVECCPSVSYWKVEMHHTLVGNTPTLRMYYLPTTFNGTKLPLDMYHNISFVNNLIMQHAECATLKEYTSYPFIDTNKVIQGMEWMSHTKSEINSTLVLDMFVTNFTSSNVMVFLRPEQHLPTSPIMILVLIGFAGFVVVSACGGGCILLALLGFKVLVTIREKSYLKQILHNNYAWTAMRAEEELNAEYRESADPPHSEGQYYE
ncbi:hypothetical protein FDP41_008834 [Naegleria fowleri]|uniref:Uncharacterized protein n=1 Tax=Naegleria fowleri TaxID=5763 RepID=A0A6A5BEW5_NAEFO|nr:uncharacterized protein FDP41_008834 [Naegleria fowleri]KAF0972585.1 hypothetical protein FDP41_008834 [Naegleria fowleri]